jgi:hypothetical protein
VSGDQVPAPQRVRVTSPRATARKPRVVPVTEEIDAQSVIGDVYMRSLMRAQLRLALAVMLVVGGLLGSLPLLLHLVPEAREWSPFGIPVLWAVLGVLVYPALLGAGWWYVRQAERTEANFVDLVGDPAEPR